MVAAGGSHAATVSTTSGCGWTGVSNSTSWITVTGGSSGTGNGTVTYNVMARTSQTPRTGTLTIAGHTVTVTQAGLCTYTVTPTTQNVVAAGGSHSATVSTTSGCAWNVVTNGASWITVTSASSAAGNGTVSYTATANTSTSPRTGTLTIAQKTVTITQAAAASTALTQPTGLVVVY